MTLHRRVYLGLFVGMLLLLGLLGPLRAMTALAGIYDAEEEVTYKEYWPVHDKWPSFALEDGDCQPLYRNWFIEATRKCDAQMTFTIPDDVSGALNAEIYLDLWRAYVEQASNFKINDSQLYHANVGLDWSRTPYIGPVDLDDLNQGANTFTLPRTRPHHTHDIAFRVYYDDAHPIVAGPGSDVTAPTGQLLTVKGDGAALAAGVGGTLSVNNNQVTLTAQVDGDAAFVEFHGYYFGYDEDNDGEWLDWHSRGRNNCHPGGARYPNYNNPTEYRCPFGNPDGGEYGTIDHIGTVKTNGAGQYSIVWDTRTVADQENIRFKIRVVDAQGNVRDAAGGVSADFDLVRTRPVVAFFDRNFRDTGLKIEPREAITQEFRSFVFPSDISDFENALVIQSYWTGARLSINGNSAMWPSFLNGDSWQLAVNSFNSSWLQAGANQLHYYTNNWVFVEKPGPYFLLQRKASVGADTKAPTVYNHLPVRNGVDVATDTDIEFQLFDGGDGVDISTVALTVGGVTVTPTIIGSKHSYIVHYDPPSDFVQGQEVPITIDACDLGGRCMSQDAYIFTVYAPPVASDVDSDDFNRCSDPLNGDLWSFTNPRGDITYAVDGEHLVINVPAGKTHDLWKTNKDAGRLMQAVANGDFDLEAKFASLPDPLQRNQIQGILIQAGTETFLRFDVSSNGTEVKAGSIFVDGANATSRSSVTVDANAGDETFYLRVSRASNTWKASYSFDGAEWTSFANFTEVLTVSAVGVHAGNAGDNPAFTAVVDYFFNRTAPINPEDATPTVLAPVTIVGNGAVEKNPTCGAPLTLTAIPDDADWRFTGWDGSVTGMDNPITLPALTGGEHVTATFKMAHAVTVNVVGPGSVGKSPEQVDYLDGEQVQLTATPDSDALFLGWSGDINSSAPSVTLTMDSDKVVTATFTTMASMSNQLTVTVVGPGTVTKTPDQTLYLDGTQVQLAANPEPGAVFLGWSGDVNSSDAAVGLTMDSDKNVTATFMMVYSLATAQTGDGTLTLSPAQGDGLPAGDYFDGATVTLTAVPAEGWRFAGWQGDLSGMETPVTVTMDGNKNVTARFVQVAKVTVDPNLGLGAGSVGITPSSAGDDFGDGYYTLGAVLTLTATPGDRAVFDGWSGDLSGSNSVVQLVVDGDQRVSATFKGLFTVTSDVEGLGVLVVTPQNSAGRPLNEYVEGEQITFEATAAQNWVFVGWTGLPGDTNPWTETITGDLDVKAVFSENPMVLTRNVIGSGTIQANPERNTFARDEEVTLTAVPAAGWVFAGWSGALSSGIDVTNAEIVLVMDVDRAVTATFEEAKQFIFLPLIMR